MQAYYGVPSATQMSGCLPRSGRVCNGVGNCTFGRREARATTPAVRSRSVKSASAESSSSTISRRQQSHSPLPCKHRNSFPRRSPQKKDRKDLLVEVLDRISLLLAKVNGSDGVSSIGVDTPETCSGKAPAQKGMVHCSSCCPKQTVTCAAPRVKTRVVLDVCQNSARASLRQDEDFHMQQKNCGVSDQRSSEAPGPATPPRDFPSAPSSSAERNSTLLSPQKNRIIPKTCPNCVAEGAAKAEQVATDQERSVARGSSPCLHRRPVSSRSLPQRTAPDDLARVSWLETGLKKLVQAEAEQTKRLLDDCREQLAAREDALNRKVLCQAAVANQLTASPCCVQKKVTCCDTAALRKAALVGNRARHQAAMLQVATRQLEEEIRNLKRRMTTLSTRLTQQNTVIADREAQLKKAEKQLNRERQVSSRLRRFYMQTSHRNKHLMSENNALEETLLDLELKLCRPQTLWALADRGPLAPSRTGNSIHTQSGSQREPTAADALAQALLKEKEVTQRMQANLDRHTERLLVDIARRSHTKCPIAQQRGCRDARPSSGISVEANVSGFRTYQYKRPWKSACVESTSKRVSRSCDSVCPSARSDGEDGQGRKSCLKRVLTNRAQKDNKMMQPLDGQHICRSFRSPCNATRPSRRSPSCDKKSPSGVNPLKNKAQFTHQLCRGCAADGCEQDQDATNDEIRVSGRGWPSSCEGNSPGTSEVQVSIRTPRNVIHACATVSPASTAAVPVDGCCEEEELSEADCRQSCGPPSAQPACIPDSKPRQRSLPREKCCSRALSPLEDPNPNHGDFALDEARPCCALSFEELQPVCSPLTSISSTGNAACSVPTLFHERRPHEPCTLPSDDPCRSLSVHAPRQQLPASDGPSASMQTSRPPSPATRTPSPRLRDNSSRGQRLRTSSPEPEGQRENRADGDSTAGLGATHPCGTRFMRTPVWNTASQDSLLPSSKTPPSSSLSEGMGSHQYHPRSGNPLLFPPRLGARLQSSDLVSSWSTPGSSLSSVDSSSVERGSGGTDLPCVSGSSISCLDACRCFQQTHDHRCCGVPATRSCRPCACETSSCPATVAALAAHRMDRPHRGTCFHNSCCCGCSQLRNKGGPVIGSTAWGCHSSSGQASFPSEPSSSICGNDTAVQLMPCSCPVLLSCPAPSQRCSRKEGNALEGCVSWALPPQGQLSLESET
ncbi:hypothetical protein NCLIV_053200 [Neospora caninum Liverpool]|uniref:Uncharacterized protein n=1 Tax=Neospora caninum (strain Liverpool) TaxID=572307 RepID=F0VME8_NEOCL|nr:hypothetical protein NCLIV_053200 [Neospora caninum Liverpool]CBZ54894.1 hypothetical protein NCLIV_053200 [Neospora caninum Liverpool]CEL69615.1 TPA: hypothetical protein BN1204_053200 [Neospora caninum Liverpool]|eukprot:XP_003884922.1 hypothetical protein NCLIV_053200 [Neospora caninum Liverpool]